MKIIKESNELEKRKKKHNKTDRKGAKGWFVHPDGGNPYSLASFNNQVSMSDGSIGSVSLGEDLEEDTYELHDSIFDNIVIQRGKDVSKKDGDLEFNLWWHEPSLNLNWYPIIQIDLNDEPIYNAEGPENPDHWKDFVREAIKKATSKNKYEIRPNKDLTESKKKNIYEIVYINSMDKSARTIVHAYSKNQAALVCRKQNRGEIYRIVSIECIKDNSIDDGEQLSLFGEDMKFKIINEDISANKIKTVKDGDKFLHGSAIVEVESIDKKKRSDGYIYVHYRVHKKDSQGRSVVRDHYAMEYNMFLNQLNEFGYIPIKDK